MPKEKSYNPVQAQRKADKAKAIKKGKAEVQQKRNERLAQSNPDRLQKQIDDLKAITVGGGKLTHHEEQVLEGLEKQIKAVKKAREALGDNAPSLGRGPPHDGASGGGRYDRGGPGGREGVLGKRRRDGGLNSSSDEDVPDDVRSIPMPRDTPPPIPKEILDKWYAKRRARRAAQFGGQDGGSGRDRGWERDSSGGATRGGGDVDSTAASAKPKAEVKTVYEAKPVVRDLRGEAVAAFVPTAVRVKMEKGSGRAGLMEPEEADRLEKEGYLKASGATGAASPPVGSKARKVMMEEVVDDDDD